MGYIWPLPEGSPISQGFGTNPGGYNPSGGHTGTDIAVPEGTPVWAPGDGVIEYAGWAKTSSGADNPWWVTTFGGVYVALNCGDAEPTFIFAHLSRVNTVPGQRVRQGDIIAYVGNTGGATTGPHLHLEALPPGYDLSSSTYGRVDPARYCTGYWSGISASSSTTITPIPPAEEDIMASIDDLRTVVREELGLIDQPGEGGKRNAGPLLDESGLIRSIWEAVREGKNGAYTAGPIVSLLASLTGQVAGLTSALTAVAGKGDAAVDLEAVTEAAREGAEQALSSLRIVTEPKEA